MRLSPARLRRRSADRAGCDVRLGLRANLRQFSLLVAISAFVGAMVGVERSTLLLLGRQEFGLGSNAAVLAFIDAFGITKALTNLAAGALVQRVGRRRLLVAGWAFSLPVPVLIALADSWYVIVVANLLLRARHAAQRRRPRRQAPRRGSADRGKCN